jgi:ribosomal protein L16 Arg81 hydroxylase
VEKRLSSCLELPVSLDWLINPTTTAAFFNEYWEQNPLVISRRRSDYFSSVLSLDDVDRAITSLNLTYPSITLKNADKGVRPADYTTRNGSLDVAAVYQLFSEGSTIVLAFLDNVLPRLTSICRGLERELNFPVQANAYLTPARAQGAKYHYDTHDVFVLQVIGSKHWTMYGTPLQLPLANQDFDSGTHERGASTMEFELEPGDVAYIPRGLVHDARSSKELSLHITVGILCYRWADLLLEWVADASLNDPAFRKSLPPGFAREGSDRSQLQEISANLLKRVATNSDCSAAITRFADQWISACPPLLAGQMEQIALLDRLRMQSIVGARPSIVFRTQRDSSSISVHAFARKITFPVHVENALRFALNEFRFSIGDLPGNLDDSGKLALVRRLVREGLMAVLGV